MENNCMWKQYKGLFAWGGSIIQIAHFVDFFEQSLWNDWMHGYGCVEHDKMWL